MTYGSVSDWIAYAALRGLEVNNDLLAEQALQRASDYIRTRYVLRLAPAYNETSEAVIEATYIAAASELAEPGFWSKTYTPAQSKVLVGVGNIKWQVVGGGNGPDAQLPTSPAIDALFFGASRYNGGPFLV